jgi:uncharacterized repeat protein (TIGR01451 family)
MNDDWFELSADMRLLELQRPNSVAPGERRWLRSRPDMPFAPVEVEEPVVHGTILMVGFDAQPRTGLIAGAVLTVTLALTNDGDAPADDVRAHLTLPVDARFQPGSLVIDGVPAPNETADAFFGEGFNLGTVAPKARRSLFARLFLEAGIEPLVLVAAVVARPPSAVLGPHALRLSRTAPPAPAHVPERPFYELDAEEEALEDPIAVPPPRLVTVLQPAELPPPPEREPVAAETVVPSEAVRLPVFTPTSSFTPASAPIPPPAPDQAVPARPVIPSTPVAPATSAMSTAPAAARLSVTAHDAGVLTVLIDRKRYAALAALFTGRSLGMTAHYLVLNALAVRDPLPGDGDATEIGDFLMVQERLLSRALIATRLNRPIETESLAAALPVFPPPTAARSGQIEIEPGVGGVRLIRAFRKSESDFIRRIVENESAHPFLRATQLFVGMCASDAALANTAMRSRLSTALAAYAATATAEINRIFLRTKLSHRPQLFKESDAGIDTCARNVLEALDAALP